MNIIRLTRASEKKIECCSIFREQRLLEKRVSVTNAEGPPVPIPNTEVKLCSGENTLRETVRENSSMLTQSRSGEIHSYDWKKGEKAKPKERKEKKEERKTSSLFTLHLNGGVAQLGEHLPCKQGVMGSNPIISTIGTNVPTGTYRLDTGNDAMKRIPAQSA